MIRLGALGLVVCIGVAAQAAPSGPAMKEAKAHFAQGKSLQDAGKWDDAIREYEAAYKLVPLPQLQFNIGQCQRLKGDKQKAIAAYEAFVAAAPDDAHADEAREQIASLRLRIQVEEAEAASRRATAEAEAAHKQAAELEAARKRIEAEEAARGRAAADEQARLRRAADEYSEIQQRKAVEREAAQRKRLLAARQVGQPLRIAGGVAAAAGFLLAGLAFAVLPDGMAQQNKLRGLQGQWGPEGMQALAQARSDAQAMVGLWATGGALVVAGAVVGITGGVMRSRAIDRVQVTMAPALLPGGGALVAAGRF